MIDKYIIKNGINQKNIRLSLSSNNSFIGYQQEINTFTEVASVDLINETTDPEMRKFKYDSGHPYVNGIMLKFNFNEAQFNDEEIIENKLNVLNSFYVMEIYNSFDENTNIKLSTNYLTKDFNIFSNYVIDQFNLREFYYLYMPEYFLKEQTGTTVNAYVKFLFYNAKSGKTSIFFNQYVNSETEEYTYFKINLDLLHKTWKFTQATGIININQIPEGNNAYIANINDNVNNFDQLKQFYPTGKTFNYITQNYFTLSGLTKGFY